MFDLTGKVAIVTGGSRGIGRACAQALASRGARVVITYLGDERAAAETVGLIEARGGHAEAERFDISNMDETERAISSAAKRLGRLDILVSNAGVSFDGLLIRLKESDLERTLAVNLKGALAAAKASVKPMMRTKGGRIIFVSSVVGEGGNPGQTSYAASKAALIGAAKCLSQEYASRGITVNAVSPGFVSTDMTAALSDEQRQGLLSQVPLGRPATPQEVAAAVVYLASDEAAYVTGHSLRVNGGMYM